MNRQNTMRMKRLSRALILLWVPFLFSTPACLTGVETEPDVDNCHSYQIMKTKKKVEYRINIFDNQSLEGILEEMNKKPGVQWQIPGEADLNLINKCLNLKNQIPQGIYFWTKIRVGIFYRCFKISQSGEMMFENHVSQDGVYGLLISKLKGTKPIKVDPAPLPHTPKTANQQGLIKYRVLKDNTLWAIANSFAYRQDREGLKALAKMNHISIRQKLKIGKFLEIPKPESCKKTVVEEFYIVKKGDTLIKIARKFLKDSFFRGKSKLRKFKRAIWTWNRDKIKRQSRINPGWKILLYLCK